MMKKKKFFATWFVMFFAMFLIGFSTKADTKTSFELSAECIENQRVNVNISLSEESITMDGFDIFCKNPNTGAYELIGCMDFCKFDYYDYEVYDSEDDYWDYEDTDDDTYIDRIELCFTDETTHTVYDTCYYQVRSFQYKKAYDTWEEEWYIDENAEKIYLETAETSVVILNNAPKITYGKRTGKTTAKIKWKKDATADGYMIYCVSNYDEKSNYTYVNTDDLSQYNLFKTIKKNSTGNAKFTKLMNGVTYTYRICSYKMINGEPVCSLMSEPKSITMDYYSYAGETYEQRIKRAFGSEKKKNTNFANASKAAKQMKTIKIKVWDFQNGKNGKKVTKTKYLTVNKRLAPSIKAMFDEIYKCKEKQVIKDIGCYSYRTGEHMYGMAIDINPNENYMIDGGKILSGSFWNPKKSKYSIPLECETVRIMERYGFYRGFWGDRKDYMHFSYFGT